MGLKRLAYMLLAYEVAGLLFYINFISSILSVSQQYGVVLVAIGCMLSAMVVGAIFSIVATLIYKLIYKITHYYDKHKYPNEMKQRMNRIRRDFNNVDNEKLLNAIEKYVSDYYLDDGIFFRELLKCAIFDGISYMISIASSPSTWMNIARMLVYFILTVLCFQNYMANDMRIKERCVNIYYMKEIQKK